MRPTVSAVATAYRPDERLADVVDAALKSCTEVIVVDNTPAGEQSHAAGLAERDGVTVIGGGVNRGLAGALNEAVRNLSADTEFVLFLDQDSVLDPTLVEKLAEHLAADPAVAIAAPAPWDAEHGRYYEPGLDRRPEVSDRDTVITSGMLVRRSAIDEVGPFREEFFVDHVDNDFCLRVRARGLRIVQDRRLKLTHSLGERHKLAGMNRSASQHPVWRNYWFARNAVILIREHRKDVPAWSRGMALYLPQWFAVRTLAEAPRGRRVAAMLGGLRDGFSGRVTASRYPTGSALS